MFPWLVPQCLHCAFEWHPEESQAWQHENSRTPVRPGMYRPDCMYPISQIQLKVVVILWLWVQNFFQLPLPTTLWLSLLSTTELNFLSPRATTLVKFSCPFWEKWNLPPSIFDEHSMSSFKNSTSEDGWDTFQLPQRWFSKPWLPCSTSETPEMRCAYGKIANSHSSAISRFCLA